MSKYGKALWIGAGIVGGGTLAAGLVLTAALRKRNAPAFAGQVVLITGGSRGLGFALAREFVRQGCRVAICARKEDELTAAVDALGREGNVAGFVCDVSRQNEVEQLIESTIARFGGIDILVNNAGEIQVGPIHSLTIADFKAAMDVMYWGLVYSTTAVLPHFLRKEGGRIVNITSIGGKIAVPHLLPYTSAKFAAVGFSEGLRAELKGTGVTVTTVVPGLMRTGSHLNVSFQGDAEREAVWFGLGATLPGISMDARRAARQIVRAAAKGEAEAILSLPAKAVALLHGVFPGTTADALGWVNRLALPPGNNPRKVQGRDTKVFQSPWMKALTILGRRAADRLHENVHAVR
jgi:NAD(P)-dependent dehydrogenase (short-subunit alcohol dehydrogenase family)